MRSQCILEPEKKSAKVPIALVTCPIDRHSGEGLVGFPGRRERRPREGAEKCPVGKIPAISQLSSTTLNDHADDRHHERSHGADN